jgi:hypothetical protein
MDLIARIILTACYPVLLGARLIAWLRGRDPLRLREPEGTCWIERPPAPAPRTYFSEADGPARTSLAIALLTALARACAPKRDPGDPRPAASNTLPSDIPDEVYTLW